MAEVIHHPEPEVVIISDSITTNQATSPFSSLGRYNRWFLVAINSILLLSGQSGAVILGRFYFDKGGQSIWIATLVQSAAFPILYFPLFFFRYPKTETLTLTLTVSHTNNFHPPILTLILVYFSLGILQAGDNLTYTIGLLYLPVSTYSLICASQLAFNAIFSVFINSQKLTMLVINLIVLLTLSASLVAVQSDSSNNETTKFIVITKKKRTIGFVCTLIASAGYALMLSLTQLTFEKVLREETFSVVLKLQIWTSLVASLFCLIGLFASGEAQELSCEWERFENGRVVYILTLVGIALAWQVCSVCAVGLIYVVSSLFSNVISMLSLPVAPVAGVFLYHEKLNGVKVVAMFLAIWGFCSYVYQNYLDEKESKSKTREIRPATPLQNSSSGLL